MRTPFGRQGGSMKDMWATDMAAHVVRSLLAKTQILEKGGKVDTVMCGAAAGCGQSFAPARYVVLASGLPLVSAARITANTSDNLLVCEDIEKAVAGVIEGNRLSDGMNESPWFPDLLKEMVTVGEETGRLEDTLNVISDYYVKEVDTAVKRALDILNPIITIALALMVVFILLSVYLPIFSMY
jgi:type II secretory pathway component PulF